MESLVLVSFQIISFDVRLARGGGGDTDVFVRAAVVKQPALAVADRSFHEYYIRNLTHFFPFLLWAKYGLIRARENFGRIFLVKERPAGGINQIVGRAVVNQEYAFFCDYRRRAWFHNLRIERSGAGGQE